MGDDYVVIKIWEKVLLDEKIPMFLVIVSYISKKSICRSNKDDAITTQ